MAVSNDPDGHAKLSEMLYAGMDNLLKTDESTEFGFFLDGASGYTMSEGDFVDIFRKVTEFYPVIMAEPREIPSASWSQ